MAPGFFSKLVKSSPVNSSNGSTRKSTSADSVNSSSASPTPKNQSPPAPIVTPGSAHLDAKTTGADTPDSHSSSASVMIGVIPPSPRDSEAFPHSSLDEHERTMQRARPRSQDARGDRVVPDRHAVSFAARPESMVSMNEDNLQTPTPGRSTQPPDWTSNSSQGSFNDSMSTHSFQPASSAGNLRGSVQNASSRSPSPPPTAERYTEPDSASSRRLRAETSPHSRRPLGPALHSVNGRSHTVPSPSPDKSKTSVSMHEKAESAPAGQYLDSPSNGEFRSGDLLTPRGDPDAMSIRSNASGGSASKKKNWRRPSVSSPTRKGKNNGIASAIAASGLSMAHPAAPGVPHATGLAQSASNGSVGNGGARSRGNSVTSQKATNQRASSSVPSVPNSWDVRPRARHTSISKSDGSDSQYQSDTNVGSSGSSGSDDDLDLNAGDIPVTGFAVASSKRNTDFHELFHNIPEGDYLIEDYGCALQREILIQGRLYISENHICFHANIFGWITDLSVPIYEITSLEKKMTAFVIPNAIQITTRQAKYTFTSFLSRDTTWDVIVNIWRLAKPEDASDDLRDSRSSSSEAVKEPLAIDGTIVNGKDLGPKVLQNKVTQCACSKRGEHFSEIALETVLPGTPDKIYNLMFASGFIKDFMRLDQKLMDIQISDWTPVETGSNLLARNMSYIKPLSNSMGPKQTKCELRDETIYCDFDDYVTTITTTRTPDVPSGGVFSVKTRTCITWANPISTRVIVSTQVEWTGRSFIKGLIEKSAIEGQKIYHADLDKAMRMYIQEHQGEFIPVGVDPSAMVPLESSSPVHEGSSSALITRGSMPEDLQRKVRERERHQRGLQWAYDTFEGAYGVAKQSTNGALELLKEAWESSSSTTILYLLIIGLVISNIWTLRQVNKQEDIRRKQKKMEEKEKWVQGIVSSLWEDMATSRTRSSSLSPAEITGGEWNSEVAQITKTLDVLEERVRNLRESLAALD